MKFHLIIIQLVIVFTRSAKIQTENRDASCSTPECQQQWPAQNRLEIIEMAVRTIVTALSSQTNDLFAPIKAILEQDLAVRSILSATPIRPNTNTTSSASSSGIKNIMLSSNKTNISTAQLITKGNSEGKLSFTPF
jgi:hypothetical protein